MKSLTIHPGRPLIGDITVPGDKSISHRTALLAALAEGHSLVENYLVSGVTMAMTGALEQLGIGLSVVGNTLQVVGHGLHGFRTPPTSLDCGNSATTLRLLAGALAAAGIPAVLDGSDGLRRRPMDRIVTPLRKMGVPVEAAEGGHAPLRLELRAIQQGLSGGEFYLPVASAQVKSCLLLAGLSADQPLTTTEPHPSRDHTERMLTAMGVQVLTADFGRRVTLTPPRSGLRPLNMVVPGDFSAAAFLIVAALVTPGSVIRMSGVGLNPTRTGLLAALSEMGADIQVENPREQSGEPLGDLVVRHSMLHGVEVAGERVTAMIDEFPVFGVAAAYAHGRTEVSQAEELRLKESDRISALCAELRKLGAAVEEKPDGFIVDGTGGLPGGAQVGAHGDHRLAMALAVAGLAAERPSVVTGAEMMAESFPGFLDALTSLGADTG